MSAQKAGYSISETDSRINSSVRRGRGAANPAAFYWGINQGEILDLPSIQNNGTIGNQNPQVLLAE